MAPKTDTRVMAERRLLNVRSGLLLLTILVLGGSVLACNFLGNLQTPEPKDFASVQTIAALTVQYELNKLDSLATQTAMTDQSISSTSSVSPSPSSSPFSGIGSPTVTITPIPPSPTFTSPPSTVTKTPFASPTLTPIQPTLTKYPSQTPSGLANKVSFRPGGTSAYYQKTIETGKSHIYTLRAAAGQTMILAVSSSGNDVYLSVKGLQDGVQLLNPSVKTSDWSGTLPATQNYQITLTTTNSSTIYFLAVEVPANLRFDPGAISKSVDGYVDVDTYFYPGVMTRVRYLAYASGGQTMTVKLNSPGIDDLSMGIIGQQDGQAYLSYQVKNSGGTLVLPSTQGYYLDVYAVSGKSTTFTLELTIR